MAPHPLTFETRNNRHRIWHWPSPGLQRDVIVALHGFSGCGRDFEVVTESSSDGYTWYAPDLIGHGESDSPTALNEYTINAMISDLDSMLGHCKIKNPVIMGYSMGGRIALQYAIERPGSIRALILIGATAGINDNRERESRRRADNELADKIVNSEIESFAINWECKPVIATQNLIPEPYRKAIKERRRLNQPIGLANSLRGFGTGVMNPVWIKLNTINCPLLLVTGDLDEKFTRLAEKMQNEISLACHVSIPLVGHATHLESPDLFAEALGTFLSGLA